jgi:hypothetical protein
VYIDKVESRVEFRGILPCSKNERKLASWNNILTVYRKISRLAYREQPDKLLYDRGMLERITNLHRSLEKGIINHFQDFEGLRALGGMLFSERAIKLIKKGIAKKRLSGPPVTDDEERMSEEIGYRLRESRAAVQEISDILKAVEDGDMTSAKALGLLVAAAERSLQHVHKIILRYPPVKD